MTRPLVALRGVGMRFANGTEALAGKSRNTPFLGRRVRGRAVATVVAGCVRFALGEEPARP